MTEREASVGGFSLDLLAKDLNSSRTVIIENQFSQTDHDHLGKLLTYAAGFDASIVIWLAEKVRDEHRQTMEWLNQKTGTDTEFFAVVVEILRIDDSKPAYDFKPLVFPNEWQKFQRQKVSASTSPKLEKYKEYFQRLIDELKESHGFPGSTSVRAKNDNRQYFSAGLSNIYYRAGFARGGKVSVSVYMGGEDKTLFDRLETRAAEIESTFGGKLEWERLDDRKQSTISVYRDGKIESPHAELEELREWHVENLLKMKKSLMPEIEMALKTMNYERF